MSSITSTSSSSSGAFNIDGLVSGMNTTDVIDKLMQVEALPQTVMKNRKAGFEAEGTAFGSVRSKLVSLKTAASTVSNPIGWEPISATSSSDAATVTGSSAGATGAVTFHIDRLASAQTLASSGTVGDTTTTSLTGGAHQLTLSVGGDTRTVDVGGGTLDEITSAINAQAGFGVTATAVQVGSGAYRLQLMGSQTGAANTITVDPAQLPGAGGAWLEIAPAADAMVTVGTIPNGYSVSSGSNAIAGLLPGLTVTLGRAGETVTINSTRDSGKLADQVAGMVDTLNAALAEIKAQTKYDPATKKGSPLTGNSTVRQIQAMLAEAISGTSTSTPAMAGIKLERDGTVTFDKAKFQEAYTRDPAGTQALFSDGAEPGLGKRLVDVVDRSINATDGLLTSAQGATTKLVDDLDDQIAKYQLRLDKRQLALRTQFTAMETALQSLQSQSSWLSSQLGSLG